MNHRDMLISKAHEQLEETAELLFSKNSKSARAAINARRDAEREISEAKTARGGSLAGQVPRSVLGDAPMKPRLVSRNAKAGAAGAAAGIAGGVLYRRHKAS